MRVADVVPARRWQEVVGGVAGELRDGTLELEKVVLARECLVEAAAPFDPVPVLDRLRAAYPSCFVFAVTRGERCFLGATPEQLVRLREGAVQAMSLAGSIARGATPEEDERLGEQLLSSAKDRAEHAVVVRAMSEGLAGACTAVAVPAEPVLLKVRNVQHLRTTVNGHARSGTTILDLVERLHPTPAVGGYPRKQALQLIREREGLDRGWYAGPLGWVNARGDGEFAVALRSALLHGAQARVFAGCGIVGDSDPAAEYAESCLKLRPLLTALAESAP
jgi:isochorismate synthase